MYITGVLQHTLKHAPLFFIYPSCSLFLVGLMQVPVSILGGIPGYTSE